MIEINDKVVIRENHRDFLTVDYFGEIITVASVNTGYLKGVYLLSGYFNRDGRVYHVQFTSDDCYKIWD